MARCRFVHPDVVRLYLVDVHRRAHTELTTFGRKTKDKADKDIFVPATPEEIADSAARVAAAEADGDWIDVKKELNAGEHRRIFTSLVKTMQTGEGGALKSELDPNLVGKSQLVEYILGWSLIDQNGKPVPFSPHALDNLDQDTYREISAAVDAHNDAVEKARTARKNDRAGETLSSAT